MVKTQYHLLKCAAGRWGGEKAKAAEILLWVIASQLCNAGQEGDPGSLPTPVWAERRTPEAEQEWYHAAFMDKGERLVKWQNSSAKTFSLRGTHFNRLWVTVTGGGWMDPINEITFWLAISAYPGALWDKDTHFSVPVRCSDVQKVVLQGMLSMQEAPSSKPHNFLGAIQPVLAHFWSAGSVCCFPSPQGSASWKPWRFLSVSWWISLWICEIHAIMLITLGVTSKYCFWELQQCQWVILEESSGTDVDLKKAHALSWRFPDWGMGEPGLVLPSLLISETPFLSISWCSSKVCMHQQFLCNTTILLMGKPAFAKPDCTWRTALCNRGHKELWSAFWDEDNLAPLHGCCAEQPGRFVSHHQWQELWSRSQDWVQFSKLPPHTQTSVIWQRIGWNLQRSEWWWWLAGFAGSEGLKCRVRAMKCSEKSSAAMLGALAFPGTQAASPERAVASQRQRWLYCWILLTVLESLIQMHGVGKTCLGHKGFYTWLYRVEWCSRQCFWVLCLLTGR